MNLLIFFIYSLCYSLKKYGIKHPFILSTLKEGYFFKATWSIAHRREIPAIWRDTIDISEDVDFVDQFKHLPGFGINSKTYVLCHFLGEWDY